METSLCLSTSTLSLHPFIWKPCRNNDAVWHWMCFASYENPIWNISSYMKGASMLQNVIKSLRRAKFMEMFKSINSNFHKNNNPRFHLSFIPFIPGLSGKYFFSAENLNSFYGRCCSFTQLHVLHMSFTCLLCYRDFYRHHKSKPSRMNISWKERSANSSRVWENIQLQHHKKILVLLLLVHDGRFVPSLRNNKMTSTYKLISN